MSEKPLMKNEVCINCDTVKPIVYLSHYEAAYSGGVMSLYECSQCRMSYHKDEIHQGIHFLEAYPLLTKGTQ